MANATKDPPEVSLLATGDAAPAPGTPIVLNAAYFELTGVNLSCFVKHLEVSPENKPVTATTFCAEVDYPSVVKWHLRVTFYQTFAAGSVYQTLNAALQAYNASGQTANFKARPYSAQTQSTTNPVISGQVVPQPFDILIGDAGALSEFPIDWNLIAPPNVDQTGVAATGATAGAPGYFTPSGAATPANLAALSGIGANPATNWATGQYVITADLLANNWNGSAWVAGKHA